MPTCEAGYERHISTVCDPISHICHEEVECYIQTTGMMGLEVFLVVCMCLIALLINTCMAELGARAEAFLLKLVVYCVIAFEIYRVYSWSIAT